MNGRHETGLHLACSRNHSEATLVLFHCLTMIVIDLDDDRPAVRHGLGYDVRHVDDDEDEDIDGDDASDRQRR